MASKYDPIRGLHVKSGFFKNVYKGEDTWVMKPAVLPLDNNANCTMDVYGIFDGHGGKQASNFVKKEALDHLTASIHQHVSSVGTEVVGEVPEDLKGYSCTHDTAYKDWIDQQRLIACLPAAYSSCFESLHNSFSKEDQESGTTATVVGIVGWEAIIANVGDSCAYLDTGSEVLQVSGNHRLDDNKKERERISKHKDVELSRSNVEGRATGPLRVWPGGLAMGRTLGDVKAGDIVLCEPEVRQVTLPEQGGRIVVASDGLWDEVGHPKTALHHIRGIPASKAARELVQMVLKKENRLKDDITVLVIDATPSDEHKMPPLLSKDGGGKLHSDYMDVEGVNVYHPLEDVDNASGAWHRLFWARRLSAAKLVAPECFQSAEELISGSLTETHLDSGDEEMKGSVPQHEGFTLQYSYALETFGETEMSSEEDESGWETVPEKSKAVPVTSRKHALSSNELSPSSVSQAPKVMKEAPPSPAPGSLQASDMSSTHGSRSFRGGRGGRRGLGRGYRSRKVQPAQQQIAGFDYPVQPQFLHDAENLGENSHMHHQQVYVDCAAPDDSFSFMDGGGFSLQQDLSVPPGFESMHPGQVAPHMPHNFQHSHHTEERRGAPKRKQHRRGGRRGRRPQTDLAGRGDQQSA